MNIKSSLYLLIIAFFTLSTLNANYEDNTPPDDYDFSPLEQQAPLLDEEINEPSQNRIHKAALVKTQLKDVPDCNLAMEALEAGPSALVAGCVSAISGDFVDSYAAMTVPGAQPLHVQCFYCSSEKEWNFQHMPRLEVGPSNGKNHLYAYYLDDSGSGLTYRTLFNKSGVKDHDLTIPEALFTKGLTNCGSGIICGKTNWKNSYISIVRNKEKKKTYMFTHGTGLERTFVRIKESEDKLQEPIGFKLFPPIKDHFEENENNPNDEYKNNEHNHKKFDHFKEPPLEKFKGAPIGNFLLDRESYPTGNQLLYEYKDNELTNIKAVNKEEQELANVSLKREKKSKKIHWFTNNESARFFFADSKNKRINKIISSQAASVTYNYNKHDLLVKKEMPEGRFLDIKYHGSGKESGRVAELKTAMGLSHTFQYDLNAGVTSVYDADGKLTKYCYDKKTKRLQAIKRHNQTHDILSQDNFYWSNSENKTGNLIAKTFEGDGKIYFSRYFDYDDFGNVKEDRLFGNLTGNSTQPLILHDEFVPYFPCEGYVKKYQYSQDERNLLLLEDDDKKIITYDYHPTQLLKTRLTISKEGKILKREFFDYDGNGVLTIAICDDGQTLNKDDLSYATERHLKLIYPRTESPIGLPQIVEEYNMDFTSNEYRLVKKTVNHHSPQGKLKQEDHYGTDKNFAYSQKWEYNNYGKVIKKVDALNQTTTFNFDENSNQILEEGPLPGWHKKFEYDLNNNLIEETEYWPNGISFKTTHTYNKLNQKIITTNPYGHTTTFEYDALGHLIKTQGPPLYIDPINIMTPVKEITCDAMGNALSCKDANGHITKSFYTIRGQPYRIEYPDGTIEQKEYSLSGLLVKEIAKNGLITTYTYDSFDRIIATHVTDPQGILLKTKTATYSTFHL